MLGLVDSFHIAAAQVRVHAHLVAHGASQQLIHRHTQRLAANVPQGLLDAGDGRHADDAHAEEGLAIHLLVQVLDAAGVLAQDHRREVLDRADHGARFPFSEASPQPCSPG